MVLGDLNFIRIFSEKRNKNLHQLDISWNEMQL